jgi:hypothetical protein
VVEHGHIVANYSGLANDDAGRVIKHDAPPNHSCWVDVHGKDLGHTGLDGQCQLLQSGQKAGFSL